MIDSATVARCSTPFGINELFTRFVACVFVALRGVLNAFRHQRTVHPNRGCSRQSPHLVLNAFRHQRTVHPIEWTFDELTRMCSTPFGINELFTGCVHAARRWRVVCSTPFGINELFTLKSPSPCRVGGWCSTPFGINELFTWLAWHGMAADQMCSTPFGINELFTSRDLADDSCSIRVLNAFRHQRTVHMTAIVARVPSRDVLNAFRHQRTVHRTVTQPRIIRCSAQRLSASTNCSPVVVTAHVLRHWPVLNAFRHQRTVHLPPSPRTARSNEVLNAFRHQRTVHAVARMLRRATPSRAQRLSASTNCSPCGTFRPGTSSTCAQRLSASTNCSPWRVFSLTTPPTSAQRLSASTNCSLGSSRSERANDALCSTPFGINELFTRPVMPGSRLRNVLNAFRHQRTVHTL